MWSQHCLLEHVCPHMIHASESRYLCAPVSLCGPLCAQVWPGCLGVWLPSVEPPLPMAVTAVERGDTAAVTEGPGGSPAAALPVHPCAVVRQVHYAFAWTHCLKIPLPRAPSRPHLCPLPPAPTSCSLLEAKRGASWSSWQGDRAAQHWVGTPTLGIRICRGRWLLQAGQG